MSRDIEGKKPGFLPRLSRAESEEALGLIQAQMSRVGVRSVYALIALTADLNPSTLYRWFADADLGRVVELPIKAVREVADALAAKGDSSGPLLELNAILDVADRREARNAELVAEFRAHRVPYGRALAAIRAAGHRLVPIEEITRE